MTDLQRLGALVAATGTVACRPGAPTTVPSDLETDLLDLADSHRIVGFLRNALDRGAVHASDEFHQEVIAHHHQALRTSLANERTAVLATELFAANRIPSRVLKGAAMAHLDYPDPAVRTFGDADLLIPRAALPQALACLQAARHRRQHPPVRAWWERRYGKAVVLFTHDGLELDLHLTIADGFYGLAVADRELFENPGEAYELAGITLTALSAPLRLVQAGYHAVLGGGSGLRALRDVAQLCCRDDAIMVEAADAARRWRGEAVLATAITRAWSTLGLDEEHSANAWASEVAIGDEDRRRLAVPAATAGEGWASEGRRAAAALQVPHRLAYAAGLALPSAASLHDRGRTWSQHLRRIIAGGRV